MGKYGDLTHRSVLRQVVLPGLSPPPVVGRIQHATSVSQTLGGPSIIFANLDIACSGGYTTRAYVVTSGIRSQDIALEKY